MLVETPDAPQYGREPYFDAELRLWMTREQRDWLKEEAAKLQVEDHPIEVTGGNKNPNMGMLIRTWIEQARTSS